MDQILTIVLGFIIGEILLILLVSWTYEQLIKNIDNFPRHPSTKRIVLIAFMLLPLFIALFTLPGVIARTNQARAYALRATSAAQNPGLSPTSPGSASTGQAVAPTSTRAVSSTSQPAVLPTRTLAASPTNSPVELPTSTPPEPSASPPAGLSTSTLAASPTHSSTAVLTSTPLEPSASPPAVLSTSTLAASPTSPPVELPTSTPIPPASPTTQPEVKRVASSNFAKPTPTAAGPVLNKVSSGDIFKATPVTTPLPNTGGSQPEAPTPTAPISNNAFQTDSTPAEPGALQGKIVYTCQIFRDTSRDQICLINADGSGFRRLTTNDFADYNFPSLSPDGQSVIYSGDETGFFEIYEMDLESGNVKALTHELGQALSPAISPDGSQVVFTLKAGGNQALWLMNRDGSNLRQLFGPPQGDGWDPIWSPDGSRILFASNQAGEAQLFTIGADGANLQQVTRMAGLPGRSDWSPDGTTIATYAGDSWRREIHLVNPDGSGLQPITDGGNNLAPSFSPDGQWIAFTSYQDNFGNENGCEIYIMRTDGSQVTRLTNNDICDWQPRWGR